ncbi:MAG: MarR family transcriptional regulator [Proteocatella sp.]
MFSLDDCMGFITNSASKKLSEEFSKRLLHYGITRVNWIAIYYIGENNEISQRELSDKMDVNESSIARLLDRMEREELTVRTKDPQDRRTTRVSLTKKGEGLRTQLIPLAEEFQNDVTKDLTVDELLVFKKVLEKMMENL